MAVDGPKGSPWTAHASMLVLVALWGLAFVAIKVANAHMSWITLTFLRFLFADVLFLGYLAIRKEERIRPSAQGLAAPPGPRIPRLHGLPPVPEPRQVQRRRHRGHGGPHHRVGPRVYRPPRRARLPGADPSLRGAGIAFAGLVVMILFANPGSQLSFSLSLGALEIVPSVIFTAVYLVLGKNYLSRYRPFVFVAYTILLGTLLTVPIVLAAWPIFVGDLARLSWEGLLPVLFLFVGPTFIGYSLWFRALERMPAAAAGAWLYISTLIAIVGGILLLREGLTQSMLVGGAMVIGGVVVAQQLARR